MGGLEPAQQISRGLGESRKPGRQLKSGQRLARRRVTFTGGDARPSSNTKSGCDTGPREVLPQKEKDRSAEGGASIVWGETKRG